MLKNLLDSMFVVSFCDLSFIIYKYIIGISIQNTTSED